MRSQNVPMSRFLCLLLFAFPVAAQIPGTWSCTVQTSLGASAVGDLERRLVPEQPGFRIEPASGHVSASALPGFARGRLLIDPPGPDESWAAWWLIKDVHGERADGLRLAGNPAGGRLQFAALHAGSLYAGECAQTETDNKAGVLDIYRPQVPPQTAVPTYYNCLAVYLHKLSVEGIGGYRIDPRETPRFQLDSRNGVFIGHMVEGFGRGRSVVRQSVPGEAWTAWWIEVASHRPQVDMLSIVPRIDSPGQHGTFVALHRELIITGICSVPDQTGEYPPPRR